MTPPLCSLCLLLFPLAHAHAQVGRFTVTPVEIMCTDGKAAFPLKTVMHLDTTTGQAHYLGLIDTNSSAWIPTVFPGPTNRLRALPWTIPSVSSAVKSIDNTHHIHAEDFTAVMMLVTNPTTGKVTYEAGTTTTKARLQPK